MMPPDRVVGLKWIVPREAWETGWLRISSRVRYYRLAEIACSLILICERVTNEQEKRKEVDNESNGS